MDFERRVLHYGLRAGVPYGVLSTITNAFEAACHAPDLVRCRKLAKRHEWRRNEISKAWYPRSFFEELAARKGYDMTYIGDWPNHTEDKMLKFKKLEKSANSKT